MTLDELEVDELLLAQGQPAAGSDRPSSARETEAEVTKYEAHYHWFFIGVTALRGSVHNSHHRYVDILMTSQTLQPTTHIVWSNTQCTGTC